MSESKLAIIGLDGVRLDVLQRFREALPNIDALMTDGATGNLTSTLPGPHSSAAWTSFSTGVNPGKHGIGDWRLRGGYQFYPATGEDIEYPRFWEYLSENGLTTGIFNIPLTAPPTEINGVHVTSWTSATDQYAYPASFQQELDAVGYELSADFYSHDDPVENLLNGIRNRRRGMEVFLEDYDWDLFVGMFYETEQAHHQLASFIDPDHPLYDPDQVKTVKRVYSAVDGAIGQLQRQFDEETTVILMSDHGFCPVYERISVNRLLEEHSHYAAPTDRDSSGSESIYVDAFEALKSSNLLRSLVRKAGRLPVVREVIANVISSYREKAGRKTVTADWSNTVAFNGYEHGGIFINRDELPEGVVNEEDIDSLVDQVIADLRNDRYLSSRVATVCRREDLFSGPNLDRLPEIVVEFQNGFLGSSGYHEQRSRDALQLREEGKPIGFHTMEGFLVTAGPDIAPGTITGASLLDIAPTVHHYFDLPIPITYDGSVLETVFRTDSEFRHRDLSYFDNSPEQENQALSNTEREGIEDRLEEMGYL